MPYIQNEREFLNATEGADFLGVSFVTFQRIQQEYGLVPEQFPGQGRQVFYLKKHLELIKNSSVKDKDKIKQQIAQDSQ